jgi:hypothetical protein
VRVGVSGVAHGAARRGPFHRLAFLDQPWSVAEENHFDMRCRLESSPGWGDRSDFLREFVGAGMTATSSLSLLLSRVGRVGAVPAALMASSPLVVLKEPAL